MPSPARYPGKAPRVTARGTIAFDVGRPGGMVLCEIDAETLLRCFGARGRSAVALVMAFEEQRGSIERVAEALLDERGDPIGPLILTAADFSRFI